MAGLLALMAGAAQASTIATLPVSQAGASFMFNSATGQLSSHSLGPNPGVEGMQTLMPGLTPGSTASDNTPGFLLVRADHRDHPGRERHGGLQRRQFRHHRERHRLHDMGPTLLTGSFGPSELVGFGTARP